MATRLGPAQIDVQLDTAKLLRQLAMLEERASKFARLRTDIQADEKRQEKEVVEKQKDSQERIREAKSSRFSLMRTAGWIIGGLATAEIALSGLGASAKRLTEDVPILEEVGELIDTVAQGLRAEISEGISKVLSLIPAYEQTYEIQKARRFLGQPVGAAESVEMFGIQHEVIATLTAAERAQRSLKVQNLANLMIDHIIGGAKKQ